MATKEELNSLLAAFGEDQDSDSGDFNAFAEFSSGPGESAMASIDNESARRKLPASFQERSESGLFGTIRKGGKALSEIGRNMTDYAFRQKPTANPFKFAAQVGVGALGVGGQALGGAISGASGVGQSLIDEDLTFGEKLSRGISGAIEFGTNTIALPATAPFYALPQEQIGESLKNSPEWLKNVGSTVGNFADTAGKMGAKFIGASPEQSGEVFESALSLIPASYGAKKVIGGLREAGIAGGIAAGRKLAKDSFEAAGRLGESVGNLATKTVPVIGESLANVGGYAAKKVGMKGVGETLENVAQASKNLRDTVSAGKDLYDLKLAALQANERAVKAASRMKIGDDAKLLKVPGASDDVRNQVVEGIREGARSAKSDNIDDIILNAEKMAMEADDAIKNAALESDVALRFKKAAGKNTAPRKIGTETVDGKAYDKLEHASVEDLADHYAGVASKSALRGESEAVREAILQSFPESTSVYTKQSLVDAIRNLSGKAFGSSNLSENAQNALRNAVGDLKAMVASKNPQISALEAKRAALFETVGRLGAISAKLKNEDFNKIGDALKKSALSAGFLVGSGGDLAVTAGAAVYNQLKGLSSKSAKSMWKDLLRNAKKSDIVTENVRLRDLKPTTLADEAAAAHSAYETEQAALRESEKAARATERAAEKAKREGTNAIRAFLKEPKGSNSGLSDALSGANQELEGAYQKFVETVNKPAKAVKAPKVKPEGTFGSKFGTKGFAEEVPSANPTPVSAKAKTPAPVAKKEVPAMKEVPAAKKPSAKKEAAPEKAPKKTVDEGMLTKEDMEWAKGELAAIKKDKALALRRMENSAYSGYFKKVANALGKSEKTLKEEIRNSLK